MNDTTSKNFEKVSNQHDHGMKASNKSISKEVSFDEKANVKRSGIRGRNAKKSVNSTMMSEGSISSGENNCDNLDTSQQSIKNKEYCCHSCR